MDEGRLSTAVEFIRRCTPDEVRRITRLAAERTVVAGLEVVRQGDRATEFFMILDGLARVRRNGVDLALLGPGDFFGEIALLDGEPRTATVDAITDLELAVLPARAFNTLVDQIANFRAELLRALAHRVRGVDATDDAALAS